MLPLMLISVIGLGSTYSRACNAITALVGLGLPAFVFLDVMVFVIS